MPPQDTPAPTLTNALELIGHERYVAYSGLVRNLHWAAAVLLALYAWLYPAEALWYLLAAWCGYTLAFHYVRIPGVRESAKIAVESWIDLLWISLVAWLSGGARSPLIFLYYIPVCSSAPLMQRSQVYLRALAAVSFVLVLGIFLDESYDPAWSLRRTALEISPVLLWPLMGLWIVTYFAAEFFSADAGVRRSLLLEAHTDDLTGLPNMRYFTRAADLRGRLGEPYAIVMADADYLKKVNDELGHAAGSELIRRVADALRHAARADDVCSRLGGDEFIVRLSGAGSEGALGFARRVRQYLGERPLDVPGESRSVSVSLGIAAYPAHGRNLSEVTRHADQALYWSKAAGRGCERVWQAGGPTP